MRCSPIVQTRTRPTGRSDVLATSMNSGIEESMLTLSGVKRKHLRWRSDVASYTRVARKIYALAAPPEILRLRLPRNILSSGGSDKLVAELLGALFHRADDPFAMSLKVVIRSGVEVGSLLLEGEVDHAGKLVGSCGDGLFGAKLCTFATVKGTECRLRTGQCLGRETKGGGQAVCGAAVLAGLVLAAADVRSRR